MAESVLSLAADHIESKLKELPEKVRSEAKELLSVIREVIKMCDDLKTRKKVMEPSCVEELRKIAYEAEDELDTLESKPYSSRRLFGSSNTSQTSKNLKKLKERIIEVKEKLSGGSHKKVLSSVRGSQEPKGHLPADGDFVIGIDDEIERVIDLILTGRSEDNDDKKRVHKQAIVGMGGSGKTTLARSIYNHNTVKQNFHFRAWVSVSRGWDTNAVLLGILKEIRGQRSRFSWPSSDDGEDKDDCNKMVSRLNNLLKRKTCLLVLDDVWELESLNSFIGLIERDSLASCPYTIVITSRQTPVDRDNWHIHQPEFLTSEDSWKLLSLVANPPEASSDDYRPLATEMLRKCQGLPLAIVALGRLLKTKGSIPEWQRVLSQINGTEATSMYGPVNEILGLGYDLLPSYLKPCFLYLGLFPAGFSIRGGTLIRMWIAEGFIKPKEKEKPSDDEETLEDAARRCLQELVDHTMVKVVRKTFSGNVKTIRIHDIMRDFCILKAEELDFLTVSSVETEDTGKTSRRATVNLSNGSTLPTNNSHLRSLALFGKSTSSTVPERYTSQANQIYLNLEQVCQMYKLLRVLDISGIKTPDGTLPKEIGTLIHLTYLRIRSTNIRELPKSIEKLHNLLTLDYWDVAVDTDIQVLNVLWRLKKLRHLYLPNEMSGSVENLQLDTLTDLVTLWGVGGGDWMLEELHKLKSTLSRLYIHRISTIEQLNAVLECPAMKDNSRMYALALDWYSFGIENLDELGAHQKLEKLRLMGKAPDGETQGRQFPNSLGKLELFYTQLKNPKTMANLGRLGSLKVLRLCKGSFIGTEWNCNETAFPVLEELKLANLPNIKEWVMEKGAMPHLKKLSIVSCIELQKMPEGLESIESLEKLEIERMPYNFISRLQKVEEWEEQGGEDFHIIQHIPEVRIRDSYALIKSDSR